MKTETLQTQADFNVWTEIWISKVGEMKPIFEIDGFKMRQVSRLVCSSCRYTSCQVTSTL